MVLAAVPALTGIVADEARADTTTAMGAALPTRTYFMSAVWDGARIDLFGGCEQEYYPCESAKILRYDPAADTVATSTATLPSARMGTSAVWDGTHAYVFGGYTTVGVALGEIVRYDPATETVDVMTATLPTPLRDSTAVWDGFYAYLLGGRDGSGARVDTILRYSPASDELIAMEATLPFALSGASAVWTGAEAVLFGGSRGAFESTAILRYDPWADSVVASAASFPVGRASTTAAWDGVEAFVFGGFAQSFTDTIYRYDPRTDSLVVMDAVLPAPRILASAVATGSDVFVLGGLGNPNAVTEIVRHRPDPPGPPVNLVAQAGSIGETLLTWDPPAQDGGGLVGHYRVFRGAESGEAAFLGFAGLQRTYTDATCPLASTCFYAVRAVNRGGEGAASSEVSAPGFAIVPFGDLPPGWQERVILDTEVPIDDGGVDPDVVRVDGTWDEDSFYTLRVRTGRFGSPAVSVNTFGVALPDAHLSIPGSVLVDSIHVRVAYRFDPDGTGPCLAKLDDVCVAGVPLDPARPGWAASWGQTAVLVIEVRASHDGNTVANGVATVPLAGQLLGAGLP